MKRFSQDHYSKVAPKYAAFRPSYSARMAHWLSELAPARELCWDAATGSGQVAVLLAEHFDEVYATDASPEQLAQTVAKRGVRYATEQAETPSLNANSADMVTVGAGAHWFDLPKFYAGVRRVARPDAVLAMFSYGVEMEGQGRLQEVIHKYVNEVLAPWWSERLAMVMSRYVAIDFPFDEIEMPAFSAESRGDLEALKELLRTWSAAQRMNAATGEDPIRRVERDLLNAWEADGPAEMSRAIRWPVFGRVGRIAG